MIPPFLFSVFHTLQVAVEIRAVRLHSFYVDAEDPLFRIIDPAACSVKFPNDIGRASA